MTHNDNHFTTYVTYFYFMSYSRFQNLNLPFFQDDFESSTFVDFWKARGVEYKFKERVEVAKLDPAIGKTKTKNL